MTKTDHALIWAGLVIIGLTIGVFFDRFGVLNTDGALIILGVGVGGLILVGLVNLVFNRGWIK